MSEGTTLLIRGFERPGEGVDLGYLVQILAAILGVLLVGPLMVFIALVSRVGAARREQRFAGLRLAGATRWQTAALAATETATAAIAGVLLGGSAISSRAPLWQRT